MGHEWDMNGTYTTKTNELSCLGTSFMTALVPAVDKKIEGMVYGLIEEKNLIVKESVKK